MFNVVRYNEYVMTEGDAIDYARLYGDMQALQRVLSRRPWNQKALRSQLNTLARQIAALEARYV